MKLSILDRIERARQRLDTHYDTCSLCQRGFKCATFNDKNRYLLQLIKEGVETGNYMGKWW